MEEFEIEFDIAPKEYEIDISDKVIEIKPTLDNLVVTPSEEEQVFKHPNSYGYDEVRVKAIEGVKEDLTTELTEQNEIIITQSSIIEEILKELGILDDLTDEQITALENMIISIENGELVFEYNDDILNIDFNIENENLIVTNGETKIDFKINENKELEVFY